MLVRFWGTRGSIPSPGAGTVRYGGNTSCVEVRSSDTLIILDCGTGARPLGGFLASQGGPLRLHIMLSHFHWDHIQGFPFFFPIFVPGSEVHVYGTAGLEQGLAEAMSGQMQYTYFPVRMDELHARITFHELGEAIFQAGQIRVQTQFLNHTSPAIGYRLTAGGTSIAYMTDHEPFWPHNPDAPLAEALVHPGDQQHVAFLTGLDLLIHDAQYTADEYPARRGWGHSTIEYVVDVAVAAGVPRLALFHHDPPRTDELLDQAVERARARARWRGSDMEVFAAAEGQVVDLVELGETTPAAATAPLITPRSPARVLVLGSAERRRALREMLVAEGYRVSEAELDHPALDLSTGEPDLALVAPPPDGDPAVAVRAASQAVRGQPIIAVLEGPVDEPLLRRVAEAASDVLVEPVGAPNLRARVRACLARLQPSAASLSAGQHTAATEPLQLVDRLSTAELGDMLQRAAPCAFRPGEVVFREGDPPGGVYYIHTGLVRIVVAGPEGGEVTVGYSGPGDTIGEMSALDGAPRSATLVVLEPVEASYVSQEAFRDTLERAPAASVRLLRLLARRLREVDRRLAGNGERGTEEQETQADSPIPARLVRRLAPLEALQQKLESTEAQLDDYARGATTASLRVRGWREAIQALRGIARLLSASGSRDALYRLALRTLVRMVPSEAAGLFILEGRRLMRVAAHGRSVPRCWEAESLPGRVTLALRMGKAPVYQVDAMAGGPQWSAIVPLRSHGRTLGVLWLRRCESLTDEDLAAAEVVGAACAVALSQRAEAEATEAHLADLESTLDMEVHRARRLGYPIGVLVSQVGGKRASSGRGNVTPRRASMAKAVRGALRRSDVVAAGPSIALGVILPGLAPESLAMVEARVRQAIRQALEGDGAKPSADATSNGQPLDVRVGGTVLYPDETDARALIDRALDTLRPM